MDEGTPIDDIIQTFKTLFKQRDNDSTHIFLSKLRNIFSGKHRSNVFTYFCLHGAATAWEIQCELKMAEATTYRALKDLRTFGFIAPALRVSKFRHNKGGPRPIIWALEGASQEEIARAYREIRKYADEQEKK